MPNIVRFDPFDELTRLQRDVSRLFDESVRGPIRSGGDGGNATNGGTALRTWAPLVDIREDANEVVVHAELPGVKREDIDIEVSGDTLTLRGDRKFEETEKRKDYVRIERAYGSFQRSFQIKIPVQFDQIKAEFKDGVLTIRLPKSEAVKPKKVPVDAS